MKILYILDTIESGGIESVVTNLASNLKRRYPHYVIDVLIAKSDYSKNEDTLVSSSVNIIRMAFNGRLNPLNIISYYSVIKKGKYDIIHVHHLRQQIWGAFLSIYFSKQLFVTTEHGVYNKKRNYSFLYLLDRLVYSRYKKIISVSYATQEALLTWLKYSANQRFSVLYNGVDTTLFQRASAMPKGSLTFLNSDIILITVCRMAYGKDVKTIIDALVYLPEDYKFLAVGDGPLLCEFICYARDKGLSDRVRFFGNSNNVASLLKSSNIYVASTLFEGFSTSIIEAMSVGLPIVGSDIFPVREALKRNEFLFKTGDARELALTIRNILETMDASDIKRFFLLESANYSIKMMVDKHLELYSSLID